MNKVKKLSGIKLLNPGFIFIKHGEIIKAMLEAFEIKSEEAVYFGDDNDEDGVALWNEKNLCQ